MALRMSPSRIPARYPGPSTVTIQALTPSGESIQEIPSSGIWYRLRCCRLRIPNTTKAPVKDAASSVGNRRVKRIFRGFLIGVNRVTGDAIDLKAQLQTSFQLME